jgi:hypothetical protein
MALARSAAVWRVVNMDREKEEISARRVSISFRRMIIFSSL